MTVHGAAQARALTDEQLDEMREKWLDAFGRVYDFVPLARYDETTKLAQYAWAEMFAAIMSLREVLVAQQAAIALVLRWAHECAEGERISPADIIYALGEERAALAASARRFHAGHNPRFKHPNCPVCSVDSGAET